MRVIWDWIELGINNVGQYQCFDIIPDHTNHIDVGFQISNAFFTNSKMKEIWNSTTYLAAYS